MCGLSGTASEKAIPKKATQKDQQKFERFRGDGLDLKIPVIRENRWVVGDGCRVVVDRNDGLLRVTGDGCLVQINRNLGTVEYVGDGGQVILGSSDVAGVSYKGDGGLVEVAGVKYYKHAARSKKGRKDKDKVVVTELVGDEGGTLRVNINVNGAANWRYGKVSTRKKVSAMANL